MRHTIKWKFRLFQMRHSYIRIRCPQAQRQFLLIRRQSEWQSLHYT